MGTIPMMTCSHN